MVDESCRQVDVKLREAVTRFREALKALVAHDEDVGSGPLTPSEHHYLSGLSVNTLKAYLGSEANQDQLPVGITHLEKFFDCFQCCKEKPMTDRTLELRQKVKEFYAKAKKEQRRVLRARKALRDGEPAAIAGSGAASQLFAALPAASPGPDFDIGDLERYARATLIGRGEETRGLMAALDALLRGASARPRVLTYFAWSGEGKTSLVSRWAVGLRARAGEPGFPPVFGHSFFRQGSELETSSEPFLNAALNFFGAGERAPKAPVARAEFLATLVQERGAIVVLDGIEPLQMEPSSATPGKLKDAPLGALLAALCNGDRGLCVLTTRYRIADLDSAGETVAPQMRLLPLSDDASVTLLRSLRLGRAREAPVLSGTDAEFLSVAKWSCGHALTLNLVGSYLLLAHRGHVRKYDTVRLEEADEEVATGPMQSGHASQVMDAYVRWFEQGDEKGRRSLVLLRALGLFDRPATIECLNALLVPPVIAGLTEPLLAATRSQLEVVCRRLEEAGLVAPNRRSLAEDRLASVDTHPLIRAYFADRLRHEPTRAWVEANERLYAHLCKTHIAAEPSDAWQLEPLYQAIVHGCRAGKHQAAYDEVFEARICGGGRQLSTGKFGAFNHDLSALSSFFERPWEKLAAALSPATRMRVASVTAFRLRSVGRFDEAAPLMEEALRFFEESGNWRAAADEANNLSVLLMHAGDLAGSVACARRALEHAARTGDLSLIRDRHATLGDPLIQLGPSRWPEARTAFETAESLQRELEPSRRQLYSTKGYRFHELLLELGEIDDLLERCERSRGWIDPKYELLDPGLNRLMHGRGWLARARQSARPADWRAAEQSLGEAMGFLSRAGFQENLARGLIAQAEVHANRAKGLVAARNDLDNAWKIAVDGRMPLFQVDIRLARLRLFAAPAGPRLADAYPWDSPSEDLRLVRESITRHCYLRRQAEAEALVLRLQPPRRRRRASVLRE